MFIFPQNINHQLAHLFMPRIPIEPMRSVTIPPKLDLELRLGIPGQTTVSEVSGTKMVPRTNRTTLVPIPKHLRLTLGHKSYGKNYRKRGRPSKNEGKPAQTKDVAGPSRKKPSKKRDYYGPCGRCGKIFDTSPFYASHMSVHYRKDETEEEKKERLSKKRKRVTQKRTQVC